MEEMLMKTKSPNHILIGLSEGLDIEYRVCPDMGDGPNIDRDVARIMFGDLGPSKRRVGALLEDILEILIHRLYVLLKDTPRDGYLEAFYHLNAAEMALRKAHAEQGVEP